jgi:hypothetical protein
MQTLRRSFALVFLILLVIQASGQFRKVRLHIYDKFTEKPVSGVTVSPVFNGNPVASDENGHLTLMVPRKVFDTVILSREDYFPYKFIISRAPFLSILMTPRSAGIDTVIYDERSLIKPADGKIYHSYTGKCLDSVTVRLDNDMIVGYTDKHGEYAMIIPRSNDSLSLSLEGFMTMKVPATININKGLVPVNPGEKEQLRLQWKNVLSLSPMELFRGGIGARYERLINGRHSVGLHSSFYWFNMTRRPTFLSQPDIDGLIIEEFNGIKLAPFYRYYFRKNVRGGKYIEAKPIAGYFSFPDLIGYEYNPAEIWTFGIGAAWGILSVKSNSHLAVNFSIGGQFFPMMDPRTWHDQGDGHDWWYIFGPGSVIEIKFTIGGIF